MCQIGAQPILCICESCLQSLPLRQGESICLLFTNENARVFLCKEIFKGNVNINYLIKVSSIRGGEKTPLLLSCSFRSFCESVDISLDQAVLSGKQLMSKQVYDLMMQNTKSNALNQQRVTIQFTVLHRNNVSYPFYSYHTNFVHRFYVMNQEYDAECFGEPIKVVRCEIDESSIILNNPSILQNENKFLLGATYCVENALREGKSIVIDSQSTIRFVCDPVIPPSISSFDYYVRQKYDFPRLLWNHAAISTVSYIREEGCITDLISLL